MYPGAKPAPESHANRGMDFEAALNEMHALYESTRQAKVVKGFVPTVLVKGGQWAKPIGKSTVDYTGVIAGGRFVAFDAKDINAKSIPLTDLQEHQREYLSFVRTLGAIAFVLVRFRRRDIYAIPIRAWDMAVVARTANVDMAEPVGKWVPTGKASINMAELPDKWRVEGYDWLKAVIR